MKFIIIVLMLLGSSVAMSEESSGEWLKVFETVETAFDYHSYNRLYEKHAFILDRNPPNHFSYATVTTTEYEYVTDQFCPDEFRFVTVKSTKVCQNSQEGDSSDDVIRGCAHSATSRPTNPCRI